jgi:hypothetical protein
MMEQNRIQSLLSAPDDLVRMLAYKRQEEKNRIGSDLADKPFSDFKLFQAVGVDTELSAAFYKMQDIYVFSQSDILSMPQLSVSMAALYQTLLKLDEDLEMTQTASEGTEQKML